MAVVSLAVNWLSATPSLYPVQQNQSVSWEDGVAFVANKGTC